MANKLTGPHDLHGANAAYHADRATPFDRLTECLSSLFDAFSQMWAMTVAPPLRRRMSGAHSFAAGLVTAASVTHDDAHHPVLDAGASERFQRLVLPQLDAAYSFARFLSRDADAAHDIVQDAFLKACRHFGSFRDGSVRAWLFAIVRNCHYDWHAARARAARYEADPEIGDEESEGGSALDRIVSEEDTPEAALIRKTEAERVRGVLLGLPQPLRELLVLRELDHLSYREIATVTALPIGTVMSRLARARSAFAETWTQDARIGRA